MARGIIKKVAQRAIQGHCKRQGSSTHNRFSTTSKNSSLDPPYHNSSSIWMRPSSTSYFRDPVVTLPDQGADPRADEDIKRNLLTPNLEIENATKTRHVVIDTHALVKLLLESGFPLAQAEALTDVMVRITQENTDALQTSMVSKPQAELSLQKVASQLAVLRRDVLIMEKTDFTELVTKIERLSYELEQMQRGLKDEINRVASGLTLDLNLEKSKVKDMHTDHTTAIEAKHVKIFEKIVNLDKEVQNVRSHIDTENAVLQTMFERYKSDTIKLAFGAVATCMTIVLGFYRLWS